MLNISLLYQFPTWLQRLYRDVVWRMDSSSKVVYITFDDGPIPECTPQVLDILSKYGIKATFFMVAENAEKYPEYNFKKHKGYSTKEHMDILRRLGPCPIHRKTFLKFLGE